MKQLAKQSSLLAAVVILVCIVGRLVTGNSYTAFVPIPYAYLDAGAFSVEDLGEEKGRVRAEEPERQDDFLKVRVRPEEPGDAVMDVRDEHGDSIAVLVYRVDRFGTVFDRSTGGFTGDSVVMTALTCFFLVESLFFYLAYRRAKGPKFYAYSTIYMAGFSLFLLLTGLLLLSTTVQHLLWPTGFSMFSVYNQICSAGANFMVVTSPFILVFALSMTVSNVALLRHERARFQNVLGILISLALVAGVAVTFVVGGANFAGSETEYRIRSTIHNVYCTAYSYFECMLIGAVICGIKAARHVPSEVFDYIIILGCGFRKDGSLPPLLKGRVDRAIRFWQDQKAAGKTATLVPSGGQGPGEIMAEAEAMRRYMISEKVPEEYILPENESRNTYQNMAFSRKLIESREKGARVLFSTTNYHVFRSGIWASLADLEAEGIGSPTRWWFWPNAFMRECAGLLVNRWKQELVLLVVLAALFGTLSMVL